MDDATRAAFDEGRDFSDKAVRSACYAPFTSMYLDPRGDALACCHNTEHRLGNVAESSLADIWRGERANELREALVRYDLGRGCRFCAWQVEDGNYRATYTHSFEGIGVDAEQPAWPKRLEFAVSNTCNLECVMCNGEWSSMIRSRREGRPPLPRVYGDRFFDELRPFLHHLTEARFLGGEPFLAAETLRIMDLMVEEGLEVPCHLTTNGTQWNPRVERILDRLPVSIAVSLDGVTAATVESIRVGASHAELLENLARYRAYTIERGTTLDLTFCLMRQNWHEFGEYLRFADHWGCRVFVNTVIQPAFSVYQLPTTEFDDMLAALERQDDRLRAELDLNRELWITELDRLRAWRDRAGSGPHGTTVDEPSRASRRPYFQPAPLPEALNADGTDHVQQTESGALVLAQAGMREQEVSLLHCDGEDVVVSVGDGTGGPGQDSFMGVSAEACVGRPFAELVALLGRLHGDQITTVRDDVVEGTAIRHVIFRRSDRTATYLQVVSYPHHEGAAGSVTAASWSPHPPAWARHPQD